MKNNQQTSEEIKTIEAAIPELKGLIESFGGTSSLSNPFIMVRIQEELQKFRPAITDAELTRARDYMNMKK